jgi:hypothetical protein
MALPLCFQKQNWMIQSFFRKKNDELKAFEDICNEKVDELNWSSFFEDSFKISLELIPKYTTS